jgi:putative ABC transport system permease protein
MNVALDVRQALRSMRRRPAVTLATVLTLGLGIGTAATMYGVVQNVLLRPLPVRDQDRLLVSWGAFQASSFGHVPLSYPALTTIRRRSQVFEQLAAIDYNGSWSVYGRAGAEVLPLRIGLVAGDLFNTLGLSPLLGRVLTGEDDQVGAAPVAVISQGLWQRRFGGDPAIIGKPLPIWTGSYTIVGVLPADFEVPAGAEAWVTLAAIRPNAITEDEYGTLDLVGRLRPGYTAADAKAELDRLLLETNDNRWATDSRLVAVVQSLRDVIVGQVRPALLVLWSAAILVFLVAVLNLGNLLIVRDLERRQEFALRRALGATRVALIRQVIIESGIIVALGALVGVGLAWAALHLIPDVAPDDLPRIGDLGFHPGVIAVSLGLAALGMVVVSALPVLSIKESHLRTPRGVAGSFLERPSRVPARTLAVAAQVSLAIVTAATALLLLRTLSQLQRLDPGFDTSGLTVLQVAFLSTSIETDEQVMRLMESTVDRVKVVAGVDHVAAVLHPPLSGTGGFDFGFVAEGQSESEAASNPYLNYEAVTPDYFSTLRIPILRGRGLSEADRAGTLPVVVVSRGLAERMWSGQDPVGKRMRWAGDSSTTGVWRTVVGVANDIRYRELLQLRPSVYVPVGQQPLLPTYLVVRSALPPGSLVPALRRAVRAADTRLDVTNVASMPVLLGRPLAQPRFNAGVLLGFAVVAVLLAAIGLYGLISFTVTQRTREVGIRLAIGAQPWQIVTLFLKRGLVPLAAGCAVGVIAVLVGGKLLSSVLYGVTPSDPAAIAGAVIGFTVIAIAAILLPVRRAAESDPSAALRLE